MIKAFCLVSDSRFNRIAQWAKNSFEYTNPSIEFTIFDINDPKYSHYDFHKWHNETINHDLRMLNPFGFLKYMAALEYMEKESVDTLILVGADVITVGSFDKALEQTEYDILHSRDIGHAPFMPLNPDMQVVYGTKFLNMCKKVFLEQMEHYHLHDYHLPNYGEMGIMNYVCNNQLVRHKAINEVYESREECFNKNVRSNVSFYFNESKQKVYTPEELEVVTIHVQTGLGTFKEYEFNKKLADCMNSSSAFSDQGVRTFIEKITKDNIWN